MERKSTCRGGGKGGAKILRQVEVMVLKGVRVSLSLLGWASPLLGLQRSLFSARRRACQLLPEW